MSKKPYNGWNIWFITGSQDLYGEETLKQVAVDSKAIAAGLDECADIPANIVWKPVVLGTDGIAAVMTEANSDSSCIGVITWMHTFSPAKMWIRGLSILDKPLFHLHTQYNRDIPWSSIDMDFMNLNQSAHGDREYGYIGARMGIKRKIAAGHWQDPVVRSEIGVWVRAAAGYREALSVKVARFGDNMRRVAVTEGDKVEAEISLGFQVDGYAVGDLVAAVAQVPDGQVRDLLAEYEALYRGVAELKKDAAAWNAVTEQAKIEAALTNFLRAGSFTAFTTTFENLYGLPQLPGLAAQRLMAAGYGFGAEGDWKHAALLRVMKTMARGLSGGTSFMEDYTYHMDPAGPMVLGAHMLEICPSVAVGMPELAVHPLSIGGKADPARLKFDGGPGAALNVSLVDMGNRFRLIVNEVEAVAPPQPMPKLPVARVMWKPLPDFKTGLEGWILSGGAHHTVFTQALTVDHVRDFAAAAGLELVEIGPGTTLKQLRQDIQIAELAARFR